MFETVVHGDIVLRTDGLGYYGGTLYQVELNDPGEFAGPLDTDILDPAVIVRTEKAHAGCN